MDTLVAGYRQQKDGPVSEALIATEDKGGKVALDLAVFDTNAPRTGQESTEIEGLVSRSFITIPAGLMDKVAREWVERHPDGVADEQYGDLETSITTSSSEPAAAFLSAAMGA